MTATNKIAHLVAYLHKEFGDKIIPALPPEAQQIIHDTTWDEEGRPSSKVDRELDDIMEEHDKLDFIDMEYIANLETSNHSSVSTNFTPKLTNAAPVAFIPEVDDCLVSTFGTTLSKSPRHGRKSPSFPNSTDTASTYSETSISSRTTRNENDIGEMKQLLRQLVEAQCSTSTTSTQRSRRNEAESSQGGSANGV